MTASNDQRVRTWFVRLDAAAGDGVEGLEVKKGRNMYTALADVADMDVVRRRGDGEGGRRDADGEYSGQGEGDVERVVICGVGTDVLS